jgi:hypothetical protein
MNIPHDITTCFIMGPHIKLLPPSLLAVLEKTVITSADFEKFLTALRRSCLQHILAGVMTPEQKKFASRFLYALAIQNFHTDFVLYVCEDEQPLIEQLEQKMGEGPGDDEGEMTFLLPLYASYKPLTLFPAQHVIARKKRNPCPTCCSSSGLLVERKSRNNSAAHPDRNEVSCAVRAQYEEHLTPAGVSAARRAERTAKN